MGEHSFNMRWTILFTRWVLEYFGTPAILGKRVCTLLHGSQNIILFQKKKCLFLNIGGDKKPGRKERMNEGGVVNLCQTSASPVFGDVAKIFMHGKQQGVRLCVYFFRVSR